VIHLKDKIKQTFFKSIIIPLVIISVALLLLVAVSRGYMFIQMEKVETKKIKATLQKLLNTKKDMIEHRLKEVELLAKLLQQEHQQIFQNQDINIGYKVHFDYAKNGVFYKTDKKGSALYYSSATKIGKKELHKAIFTERMDKTFQTIVNSNDLVVQAYFNSYDNMNRIYPYIDKIYKQYPSAIVMQDYNFYYFNIKEEYKPLRLYRYRGGIRIMVFTYPLEANKKTNRNHKFTTRK